MTTTKSFCRRGTVALAFCCTLSCSNGKSDHDSQKPETFVRNESDQTAEDAEKITPEAAPERPAGHAGKDSASVGPVAPHSPPRGGRAD